ncbi:hypothetical protein BCR44DRAFT_1439235 [Catenaria anguillulae PL171]|uniref:Uncharacterized protein n=1 Tax=Catenaria anguillulae PL171 TaxID=765915 RepID=A0A1Y2HEG1_9FUNG|nr:hypothetical protein BCR44DRAFT_1439235 [Catenaria anguillulae PL171]
MSVSVGSAVHLHLLALADWSVRLRAGKLEERSRAAWRGWRRFSRTGYVPGPVTICTETSNLAWLGLLNARRGPQVPGADGGAENGSGLANGVQRC